MNEGRVESQLKELLEALSGDQDVQDILGDEMFADARVESFEEAGVMTTNKGLVVRMGDGSEFQLTIVRSR